MKVVATARKPEEFKDLSATYGDSIPAVKLDVTSPVDVEKAVATAVSSEGSRHERARLVQLFINTMTYLAKIAVKHLAPAA